MDISVGAWYNAAYTSSLGPAPDYVEKATMTGWHRFLGVAALWTVALPGQAQTDPAQHCKLELVRLEPLTRRRCRPWIGAYRSVSPQNVFWHSGKDGSWKAIDESVEKSFQEVVKKEPEKYLANDPIRGVVKLGSKKYGFVLDHKNAKSQQYDRLYFDLNLQRRLERRHAIDAITPPVAAGPVRSRSTRTPTSPASI